MNGLRRVSFGTLERNQSLRQSTRESRPLQLSEKDEHEVASWKQKTIDTRNLITASTDGLGVISKNTTLEKNQDKEEDTFESLIMKSKDILYNLSKKIVCKITTNKEIKALFPDMDLGKEIIISSILSPKTMTKTSLNHSLSDDYMLGLETIRSEIVKIVSEYLDEEYDFTQNLEGILNEALASSGACPHLIIAEAVLDEIVNSDLLASMSMESFSIAIENVQDAVDYTTGIVDNSLQLQTELNVEEPSLENFIEYLVSPKVLGYTDNTNVFKLGNIRNELRSSVTRHDRRYGVGLTLESHKKLDAIDLARFKPKGYEPKPLQEIKNKYSASRKSIGKPLHMRLPTQSVISLCTSSNTKDPERYLILLDGNYRPISTTGDDERQANSVNGMLHSNSNTGNPIRDVYRDLIGDKKYAVDPAKMFDLYRQTLDRQISEVTRSALKGEKLIINNIEEMYFVLFLRALEGQQTNVLCVPKENLVHYALEYDEQGLGKTLYDDLHVLCSISAILFFAKVMAYTRSAIGITEVDLKLDPNDKDPRKTIEIFTSELLRLRQTTLPVGMLKPNELTNWAVQSGIKINVEEHPLLPDVSATYSKGGMSVDIPESEIEDYLVKQRIRGIGLRPENIDDAFSPDFAAESLFNNALLAKRIMGHQNNFNPCINKHASLIIFNDMKLRQQLKEVIMKHKDKISETLIEEEKSFLSKAPEEFVEYYLDRLATCYKVTLPSIIDSMTDSTQEEFETYMDKVEKMFDYIQNSDMLDEEVTGEVGKYLDISKGAFMSYFATKWSATNNHLPEVLEILSHDQKKMTAILSSVKSHYQAVIGNTMKIVDCVKEVRAAGDKDINNNRQAIVDLGGGEPTSDY